LLSAEDLAEGGSEVGIEHGVDNGIEQAVEEAKPADDAEHERRYVETSFGAKRTDESDDEERKPAADEGSGDDGERACRFALPLLFQTLLRALLLQ